MIIAFTIIALITISGLSIGIYAIFIPFLQNIGSIQQYNSAYYGAVVGVERALLVSKQQEFGFSGSGGRDESINRGPISDQNNDQFGLLSEENNGIQRTIQGQTDRIPNTNAGNITPIFQTITSNNYNSLSYNQDLDIKIQVNEQKDPEKFYSQEQDIQNFQGTQIQTHIRLPEKIGGLLCDTCNHNMDDISNNIIVLRQRIGEYDGQPFTIIPHTDTEKDLDMAGPDDMHIRESIINNTSPSVEPILSFGLGFSPLQTASTINEHSGFGEGYESIKTIPFQGLWEDNNTSMLALNYQIIQDAQNSDGFVYPFLEYYVEANDMISDTHRHITGQGKINPYQVKIQIKKPQQQGQAGSYFSIIF